MPILPKSFVRHVVLFVFIILFPTFSLAEMVSVSGDNVNLRTGPSTTSPVRWRYGSGFPLQVLEKKGEWLKVQDFENDTGWLHKSLTAGTGHMIVKVNKGSDEKINIRSGPGTNHKVVGMAHYGVVFRTIEQKNGWALVRHESGLEGWILRSLLWGF
ncbi:SH3 domain-containing protein [Desulfofustis limnaeus]|jgi:SH3-like domain-containing protein|uniref:SH3 domain-containing protein n=1 Tax=Desulfofustis limnaeus TaxID=2740163 RepID=UPI0024DF70D0|nr:SH3 domain-containing protein [Desulfofustis limnaeus]